jgi:hypothetical protein
VEIPSRFATTAVESTKTSADLSSNTRDKRKVMLLSTPRISGDRLALSIRGNMGNKLETF